MQIIGLWRAARQEEWPGGANSTRTMRVVVQRVRYAQVTLQSTGEVRAIGPGLVVLLGVGHDETYAAARFLARKAADLRLFDDADGKMNLSLRETGGAMLVVSQLTLMGDARRGRHLSFAAAAPPASALFYYRSFVGAVRALGISVQTTEFGAEMRVLLENDGPVTLVIDSP